MRREPRFDSTKWSCGGSWAMTMSEQVGALVRMPAKAI